MLKCSIEKNVGISAHIFSGKTNKTFLAFRCEGDHKKQDLILKNCFIRKSLDSCGEKHPYFKNLFCQFLQLLNMLYLRGSLHGLHVKGINEIKVNQLSKNK